MKIYVASSWRNDFQPTVVENLIAEGHTPYDFRHPDPADPENKGFSWSKINPRWNETGVTPKEYMSLLTHPVAKQGFALDMAALEAADVCIMVMPCGLSAGIEFGYAVGAQIPTAVYIPGMRDPDLMIKMADLITTEWMDVAHWLRRLASGYTGDHV